MSLLVLVLSYSIGTILVFLILSRYWSKEVGLAGAGAWAVSGQLYAITMTGMETLGAVVLVLAALYAFSRFDRESHSSRHAWPVASFGLLTGAAFLARMDAPVFLAPFALYLLFRLLRQKGFRRAILLVLLPSVMCLSWISYIGIMTGEIFPDSAAALRVLRGIDNRILITDPELVRQSVVELFRGVGGFIFPGAQLGSRTDLGAVLSALFFLGVLLSVRGEKRWDDPRRVFALLIGCGAMAWCLYYVLFQSGFRYYYFAYLGISIFCFAIPSVVSRLKHSVAFFGLTLVLCLSVWSRPGLRAPQEYDKYHAALALNDLLAELSPGGNIGAFNAGVYNYFCRKDIVNLDGVVNPEARRALQRNALPDYIRAKGIRYLIEHDIGQAASFDRFVKDPRVRVSKLIDLRSFYRPYDEAYAKDTFLWKVEIDGARDTTLISR